MILSEKDLENYICENQNEFIKQLKIIYCEENDIKDKKTFTITKWCRSLSQNDNRRKSSVNLIECSFTIDFIIKFVTQGSCL